MRENAPCVPFVPPVAFAIVMSTGTLACATLSQAASFPVLTLPATILCWLNFAIFAGLCPFALFSWHRNRAKTRGFCALPSDASMFSTAGIALLVMAHQCLLFELGTLPAFLLWLAGAIVNFALNLGIFFRIFIERHGLERIAPVLFIPVVGLLVVPAGGAALSIDFSPPWNQIMELVGLLALGGGLLLYVGIFASMLQRHIFLEPLPDQLAPTYWIHLAPLGWGSISVISMGHILAPQPTQETLLFLCLIAWGAAAWWTIMAAMLTIRALARRGMTFSLAWWSFIFPLGSFTLLTKLLKINFSHEISFAVWLLMAIIWTLAGLRTVALVRAKIAF